MIKTGLKRIMETEVIPIDKNGFYRIRHEPVSSHPDDENLLQTIDSRLRASARHGGKGFFEFSFTDPPHRKPLRGRGQ